MDRTDTPRTLSTGQAAAYLHVTRQHVWRLIATGRLPAERRGTWWRVRWLDLVLFDARERRRVGRPRVQGVALHLEARRWSRECDRIYVKLGLPPPR